MNVTGVTSPEAQLSPGRHIGIAAKAWNLARGNALGAMGAAIFVLMLVMAIFSPILATHPPNEQNADDRLLPPSASHWMGTDEAGRDVWSRVVYGARVSLYVGVVGVVLATLLGTVVGIASAYLGGRSDVIIQRIVEVFLAFPTLILALVIMAMLGSSVTNLIFAVVSPSPGASPASSAAAPWPSRRNPTSTPPAPSAPATCALWPATSSPTSWPP